MSSTPNNPALQATYTSPTSTKVFSHPLPPQKTSSTEERTAYLSALRASVSKMQEEVNTFLTEKMEEDNAADAKAGKGGKVVDEQKEEENYGEEGVEDG